MATDKNPRTVVEFRDYEGAEDAPCHKAARVFINGSQVMVEDGGVSIEFGEPKMTTVTLRLLPNEVHFNH